MNIINLTRDEQIDAIFVVASITHDTKLIQEVLTHVAYQDLPPTAQNIIRNLMPKKSSFTNQNDFIKYGIENSLFGLSKRNKEHYALYCILTDFYMELDMSELCRQLNYDVDDLGAEGLDLLMEDYDTFFFEQAWNAIKRNETEYYANITEVIESLNE